MSCLPEPFYEQDGITIYCGDCREILPLLPPDDYALVTDPPYGVSLGKHGAAMDGRADRVLIKGGYATYEDTPENFDAVVVPAIKQSLQISRRGLVFMAGHMVWRLPPATALGGVYLPAAQGRHQWGFNSFALCLLYGAAPDLNLGARATGIKSTEAADRGFHPCPKPLSWMTWALGIASTSSETILDPFVGSGTTLRAAKDLGRSAVGIEINKDYCEAAVARLSQGVLLPC